MSSRTLKFLSVFFSLVAFLQVGCSDYLSGKKHTPEVIELKNTQLQCLSKVPEEIKKFTDGTASDQELSDSVVCLQQALIYFKDRTKGSGIDAYTAADMRSFFGKYFLKENNVTSELSLDLMRLKQVLLGGSSQEITKTEISKLVELLSDIRREAILIRPHVKNLTLSSVDVKNEELNESFRVFRSSLQRLLEKTDITRSDYSLEEAKSLFSGLADFITGDKPFTLYVQASEYLPLLESLKKVLLGEDARLLTGSDWRKALNIWIDLYELLIKGGYSLKGGQTWDAKALNKYLELGQGFLRLLEKSPRMQKEGNISFQDLDNLFSEINGQGWLPVEVSDHAIQETYRVIVARMLDYERKGDSRGLSGLQLKHLLALKRELAIFEMQQLFAEKVLSQGRMASTDLVIEAQKAPLAEFFQELNVKDVLEQKSLADSWQHFIKLLSTSHPMHFDEKGRVTVSAQVRELGYDWKALTRFSIMSSLSRLLVLGYSERSGSNLENLALVKDAKRRLNGLSDWYRDFDSLGIEIKAFDPRSVDSGARTFLEASLFTPSGDGDDLLNSVETFEFVSMLLSGGLGTSSLIQQGLQSAGCVQPKTVDVFGFSMFNEACVRSHLRSEFSQYFANLPAMSRWVSGLNTEEFNDFFDDLLTVSKVDKNLASSLVEVADLRTAVMVLHYTESVMVQYDRNRDDKLTSDEIKAASTKFLGFLRGLSPGTSDGNLQSAFAYLVIYGRIPSASDVITFQLKEFFITAEGAQRGQVLKVFRTLKEGLK